MFVHEPRNVESTGESTHSTTTRWLLMPSAERSVSKYRPRGRLLRSSTQLVPLIFSCSTSRPSASVRVMRASCNGEGMLMYTWSWVGLGNRQKASALVSVTPTSSALNSTTHTSSTPWSPDTSPLFEPVHPAKTRQQRTPRSKHPFSKNSRSSIGRLVQLGIRCFPMIQSWRVLAAFAIPVGQMRAHHRHPR